jgi:hypothetical protein
MSEEWAQAEAEILKQRYPNLECHEDGWCCLAPYSLPEGWSLAEVELAFRVPANLPGEVPYGFWTRPTLTLKHGGAPSNTSGPVETGFGPGWLQWSWQLEEWQPGAKPGEGSGMVDHVRSIAYRFKELN